MKGLIFLLLIFTSVNLFAQSNRASNEIFYLFNAKDEPVKTLGAASTFEVVSKENDTSYIVRYYKNYGSMIWQQSFKDSSLKIANGRFAWYDKDGYLDSTGCMKGGKRNGEWIYLDSLQKSQLKNAKEGIKKIGKNAFQLLSNFQYSSKFYRTGDENNAVKNVEKSANYAKEETKEWARYLKRSLNQQLGKLNSNYGFGGRSASEVISFFVNKDETISDVYLLHSSGFPYDKEVMRKVKTAKGISALKNNQSNIGHRENQNIIFPYQY